MTMTVPVRFCPVLPAYAEPGSETLKTGTTDPPRRPGRRCPKGGSFRTPSTPPCAYVPERLPSRITRCQADDLALRRASGRVALSCRGSMRLSADRAGTARY